MRLEIEEPTVFTGSPIWVIASRSSGTSMNSRRSVVLTPSRPASMDR
jgi:hypothetical protein